MKRMDQMYRHDRRHKPPHPLRRVLGWVVVAAGLAMLVLPGPGLLALALGVILLGRRDPTLRRWALLLRIHLRRLSRAEQRQLRLIGRWLRQKHQTARAFVRQELHRHARGEPLSAAVRLWIGFTVISAVVGLGAGLLMLLF
jgi:hypothetical protein